MGDLISAQDELRLRTLASELAKDIEDLPIILTRLGLTQPEYEELCETKMFRGMLDQAYHEWQGATNTGKRIKLKAAINIEEALPSMHAAIVNEKENLASRVKAFEVMARIGGLGNPEPIAAAQGATFQLTIHLSNGSDISLPMNVDDKPPIILGDVIEEPLLRQSNPDDISSGLGQSNPGDISSGLGQSKVFDTVPHETMD
jgi:hypothetical protein